MFFSKNRALKNSRKSRSKIAIVGTVGVPARYGGFETLAENLAIFHHEHRVACDLKIYCSTRAYDERSEQFRSADLVYLSLEANGFQSIFYDGFSLAHALWNRSNVVLLLGVSGAIFLPLIRAISSLKIVTNIDGLEWKRSKWSALHREYLRISEALAVRFSHSLVADNAAIQKYIADQYGRPSRVIAYGGDQAVETVTPDGMEPTLPQGYALALCRIEPENNIHVILEAFSELNMPLVIVGNWKNSAYGRSLHDRFHNRESIHLFDATYEKVLLYWIRSRAKAYIHGHSAGGTNPALVEMMHFGIPVFAYDCAYNRNTTDNRATYFQNAGSLREQVLALSSEDARTQGNALRAIARKDYTWDAISRQYFDLLMQTARARSGAN